MNDNMNKTLAILALTAALNGCAGGPPMSPEEAAYRQDYNLRVLEMINQRQSDRGFNRAIRGIGCNPSNFAIIRPPLRPFRRQNLDRLLEDPVSPRLRGAGDAALFG